MRLESPKLTRSRKRRSYARDRLKRLLQDERGLEPQDPITKPRQRRIPTRISSTAFGVIPTIDLDDEPRPDSGKVGDEAPNGHLPPKPDSELLISKQQPGNLAPKA